MPGGDTEVSFVDIHNIASVAAKVLAEHDGNSGRHIGRAYNITEPETLLIIKQLKCNEMQAELCKYLSFSSVKSEAKVILKKHAAHLLPLFEMPRYIASQPICYLNILI